MKIMPEKIQACTGFEPMTSAIPVQRRGHGFKSRTGLNFFRPYFHHCLSSAHYCEDHFRSQIYLCFFYHIKCAFVILGFCYPFNGLCRNEVYCICKYKTKFLRIYDKNWQRWIFICVVTSLKYSFSYYDLLGS